MVRRLSPAQSVPTLQCLCGLAARLALFITTSLNEEVVIMAVTVRHGVNSITSESVAGKTVAAVREEVEEV